MSGCTNSLELLINLRGLDVKKTVPDILFCYLQGERGCNDLEGDYSFEELRWAQVQAATNSASPQTLLQDFQAAKYAQSQQFEVCNFL